MQVGNAITNATAILVATKGTKATVKDLESLVLEVAQLADRVKDKLKNKPEVAATKPKEKEEIDDLVGDSEAANAGEMEDDDLPFDLDD